MTQQYGFKDANGALTKGANFSFPRLRLGRRAVKRDSRTLMLARYLAPALPAPPATADWTKGITSWGVMCNDVLGCCTIAGAGHAVQVFSANSRVEVTVPDGEIEAYYSRWDGYVRGDPSTDNGGIELDVLNNWRQQKFAGHVLLGYADVDPSNHLQVRQAIALFGGLYIGMEVPAFVMTGMVPAVWDLVSDGKDGGVVGGHCVFVTGYSDEILTFISWGVLCRMTWAFWDRYVDEAHALLSQDFLNAQGLSPSQFNLDQLRADLALIR